MPFYYRHEKDECLKIMWNKLALTIKTYKVALLTIQKVAEECLKQHATQEEAEDAFKAIQMIVLTALKMTDPTVKKTA